jgi:glutamate carboxypeptidase
VDLNLRGLLRYCQSELEPMLECLRRAVEIESPSDSKAGVDRLGGFFAREFERRHGIVHVLGHATAGSSVLAEFWPESPAVLPERGRVAVAREAAEFRQRDKQRVAPRHSKPILLLGHLDTVWPVGTLAQMPFRIRHGRAYGPGSFDMKSGIVCGLWAIRALQAMKVAPASPVRFFLNSDEEVASVAFRDQILSEGKRARAVLVLEPAAAGGALKTARKGVGDFKITVCGRMAHAGVNPEAGVNAISELARQVRRIEKLARPRRGLTINVNLIQGGTRTNVIPERATAWVDVRVPRRDDREWIEKEIRSLRPIHPEARLEIEGGINRPPLERQMAVELFRGARELGRELGMELEEASTGGGSDGSFTAALGTPTLDGLGGVGDGAHARHEHVVIRELPRRAALLAAMIATL